MYTILARLWSIFPETWCGWLLWLLNAKMVVGVSGVLLNDQDEVLLLRHRFHPRNPWGLPGGWICRGERVDEALRREVREETQLDVVVEGIVLQKSTAISLEFILMGRIIGGELSLDAKEILEARFFQPQALPAGVHRDHLEAIARVFAAGEMQVELPGIQGRPLMHESSL